MRRLRFGVPRAKRVVFSTTTSTGAKSLFRGELAWFRDRGWSVVYVSTPGPQAEALARREGVSFSGIEMERGIAPLADARALIEWITLLVRLRPAAVSVGTPKAALLGIVAAWITRVPNRMYLVRGLRLEGSRPPLYWILWAMEKITAGMATSVVVVSRSLGDQLVDRGIVARSRVQLLGHGSSNGVDAKAIERRVQEADRNEIRDNLGVDRDAFLIGFVGRVSRDKGVHTLLEAYRLMADPAVEMLVIGRTEDEELSDAIAASGKQVHRIEFTEDVWGVMSALDVLCLPTLREGFPNVVLEAAAAGIPSVVTRATGAVDSVVDGVTGFLVDVEDSAALADALELLRQSPEMRESMGNRARTRVKKDFRAVPLWRAREVLLLGDTSGEVCEEQR